MFSKDEIKKDDFDVYIKNEPILGESYNLDNEIYSHPTHFGTNDFIVQENLTYINNSNVYSMINDYKPKIKRPRTDDTENVHTSKRMKTEGLPNFRRPWPTTSKSYTNFSISSLIKEDESNSHDIENNRNLQNQRSYMHDVSNINDYDGSFNPNESFNFQNVNTNFVKKECDDFSYTSRISDGECRPIMASIADLRNDLDISNDSEDDENEYFNENNGSSKNYTNNSTNKNINQEIKSETHVNDSNLIWTIQSAKTEKLKLVISKDNDNAPKIEKKQIEVYDNCIDRDEQPLMLPIKQSTIEDKSQRKMAKLKKYKKSIEREKSFNNIPDNHKKSLKISTPLRDIEKKKESNSLRRHSLPSKIDIKPNINQLLSNQVNEKKIEQPPSRVFMKKIKWKNILQKDKIITEESVKVHKMVLRQDDGKTSEVAVKAHLEKIDWTDLGLIPKTMVIEESAALAKLQGIKGIPYLCGVIIEDPPAIVMSYHKGRTIGDYLEEGDTLFALKTFVRACEIVGKIHYRGWAHYDLHADNILGRVNNKGHMMVTLVNYGFCRATNVNPHYGIYSDPEDLEGHHLPVDIINKTCNGSYVDRYSLCYMLEEIHSQMKEKSETNEIRDASSVGLMTEHPHQRPSSTNLAQLVTKLISKHTHESWKFNVDD